MPKRTTPDSTLPSRAELAAVYETVADGSCAVDELSLRLSTVVESDDFNPGAAVDDGYVGLLWRFIQDVELLAISLGEDSRKLHEQLHEISGALESERERERPSGSRVSWAVTEADDG